MHPDQKTSHGQLFSNMLPRMYYCEGTLNSRLELLRFPCNDQELFVLKTSSGIMTVNTNNVWERKQKTFMVVFTIYS